MSVGAQQHGMVALDSAADPVFPALLWNDNRSAADADALATAFYVMGLDGAKQYCEQTEDVSALLVCPGKRRGSIELHPLGLADDDWRRV